MQVETHDEVLLEHAGQAFERAAQDTLDDARRRADRYSRTGRFAKSLELSEVDVTNDALVVRLGSPLPSASAKERGAYIQAEKGPYLVFQGRGRWHKVQAVRIPPRPAVVPAGKRFGEYLLARLREALP